MEDLICIAELATKANEEHRAALSHAKKTIEHAWRAGEFLLKAKDACDHGKWLGWLEANFEVSQQTASDYMRLRRKYQHAGNLPDSIRTALSPPKKAKSSGFGPAVDVYLRAELIHTGHVYQFERLQFLDIVERYSTTEFPPFANGEDAGVMLFLLRPEGYCPLFAVPDDRLGVFQDALDAFFADATDGVALWKRHAFWWASFAAIHPVSVPMLTDAITRWRERFVAAMTYLQIHEKRPFLQREFQQRQNEADQLSYELWWGHRDDLKSAGAISWRGDWSTSLQDEVYAMLGNGSVPLPSNFNEHKPRCQERLDLFRQMQACEV